jgi:glycosyltransferase involved in cell wall biosynthesis
VVVQGGGAGEAVMDGVNGCLVRNDPAAFAEAVLTILREPDLHSRLSQNARKSVRNHSPLRSALQVIEVYRAALQAREATKEPVFVNA